MRSEVSTRLSSADHEGQGQDLSELLVDRRIDSLVAMTQVRAHQLRVEIDIALSIYVPQVDALRLQENERRGGPPGGGGERDR